MAKDQIHYVPPSVEASYYVTFSSAEIMAIALETFEYSTEIDDKAGLDAAEKIFAIAEAKIASGL